MPRWKYTDPGETPRTVSAGILDALGRGFLIATASFVAGTMLGTANLAVGLWTIGVIAAGGVGCMVGAALVKNMGCPRWAKRSGGSPQAAQVGKVTAAAPSAVEAAQDVAPEEYRARRRVLDGRRREQGTGRGI
jgi:hypothetical protein